MSKQKMFQEIDARGFSLSPDLWTEEDALFIAQAEKTLFVEVIESRSQGLQMLNRFVSFRNGLAYLKDMQ